MNTQHSFFILSLQSPVRILHLWHISVESTHILNAQQPHVSVATKADGIGLNDTLQTGNSDHFWNGLCFLIPFISITNSYITYVMVKTQ